MGEISSNDSRDQIVRLDQDSRPGSIDLAAGTFSPTATPTGLILRQFLLSREESIRHSSSLAQRFMQIVDGVHQEIEETPIARLSIHEIGKRRADELAATESSYCEVLRALQVNNAEKQDLITRYRVTRDPKLALAVYLNFERPESEWSEQDHAEARQFRLLRQKEVNRFLHHLLSHSNAFWIKASAKTLEAFCANAPLPELIYAVQGERPKFSHQPNLPQAEVLDYMLAHASLNTRVGERYTTEAQQLYLRTQNFELRDRIAEIAALHRQDFREFYRSAAVQSKDTNAGIFAVRHLAAAHLSDQRAIAPLLAHENSAVVFESVRLLWQHEPAEPSDYVFDQVESDITRTGASAALASVIRLCDPGSPLSARAMREFRKILNSIELRVEDVDALVSEKGILLGRDGPGEIFPACQYSSIGALVQNHLSLEAVLALLNDTPAIAGNFEPLLRNAWEAEPDRLLNSLKRALDNGDMSLTNLAYRAAGFVPHQPKEHTDA